MSTTTQGCAAKSFGASPVRTFSSDLMALVLMRNRIHRSSRSQKTRLYCRLTCCSVFVRLWLKLTVYPLFAFLPVSMHFRPLMPCRPGRDGGRGRESGGVPQEEWGKRATTQG